MVRLLRQAVCNGARERGLSIRWQQEGKAVMARRSSSVSPLRFNHQRHCNRSTNQCRLSPQGVYELHGIGLLEIIRNLPSSRQLHTLRYVGHGTRRRQGWDSAKNILPMPISPVGIHARCGPLAAGEGEKVRRASIVSHALHMLTSGPNARRYCP